MTENIALVVVDVQNVMFETPGSTLYEEERVLNTIIGLIAKARAADIPIVYIQHTTEGIGSEFEEGSYNWQIRADIAPHEGDTVSLKKSYDAFFNTPLDAKLTALGAKTLVFCGLQTEVCVDTTVRSAMAHGYTSILVGDAHSTYDNGVLAAKDIVDHHNTVLNKRFCSVVLAENIEF